MKSCVNVFLSVALAAAAHAGEVRLPLDGEWDLAGTNAAGRTVSCAMSVPGDVQSALLASGEIVDPFFGANETNVQWVGQVEWRLKRVFRCSSKMARLPSVVLRLEDVDTFADFTLNGRPIGRTGNRFRRWEFDVTGLLLSGTNELAVVFRSAEGEALSRAARASRTYRSANASQFKPIAHIRKPQCHGGWDWGPRQMTVGLCGTVELIGTDDFRIDYVHSETEFSEDLSRCTLKVLANISDCKGRHSIVTNRVEIDHPPLWWPRGAGPQDFYRYRVRVRDRWVEGRVGLRKLEVRADGDGFTVSVNGRDLFMKGANWIPCDAFENRQTADRYRQLLESAAAANMNMLRVWGGGKYEKDCFYDLCDELGLLIWQDFMFACGLYPADDAFLSDVEAELQHQVKRLRSHACVALWCGDNECINFINWLPESKRDPKPYFEDFNRRSARSALVVSREDSSRLYWPSSPCPSPWAKATKRNDETKGDMHCWSVWHDNRKFETYRRTSPRFCSEFGFQSFPSSEVAARFCPPGEAYPGCSAFEWHQKNPGGNARIRKTFEWYFPELRDAASELLLSQFQQAMAIQTAVESWRMQRPHCMGTLYWQLNDTWPVSSWSSIEYGGKWKPLHYMARRFYAPVAVMARPEIVKGVSDMTKGKILVVNDTADSVSGEILIEYWTYEGKVAAAETKSVVLAPDSSTQVGEFDNSTGNGQRQATFLVLTLKTKHGVYQNDWHFGSYKDKALARANIRQTVRRSETQGPLVEVSTDRPAFFVWVESIGAVAPTDDNAFVLLPGRPRVLRLAPGVDADTLQVRHLAECFR